MNTIVVTAAVVERDGAFLVTRRLEGTHLAGAWEFPGGKCELGEPLEACLWREIREELGPEAMLAAVRTAVREQPAAAPVAAPSAGTDTDAWLRHLQRIEERIERLERTVATAVDLLQRTLHRDRATKPGTPGGR